MRTDGLGQLDREEAGTRASAQEDFAGPIWTFPALTGPHASLLMSRIPAFTSFFSVFEGGSLKLLRAIWLATVKVWFVCLKPS